jgi:hypothetical protein
MTALVKPSASVLRSVRWLALLLVSSLACIPTAEARAQDACAAVARDSVRWHYERALALHAEEKPGRALAALYAAIDTAEAERREFESRVKARIPASEKERIEKVERDAKDRRLAGSTAQRDAQRLFKREMELLAKRRLTEPEILRWRALKREAAETYYLLAFLHFQNQRTADALADLRHVVDAEDGAALNDGDAPQDDAPEHVPARLLLARTLQQVKAWDKVSAHIIRLLRELNLTDARAQAALRRLSFYLGKPTPSPKLSEAVQAALDVADEALADPAIYRAATIDRGLHDSLVYAELVENFAEDDDYARMEAVLLEQLAARGGFAPLAYIGLGETAETAARRAEADNDAAAAAAKYALAIQRYETAVAQMKHLGLTPESGDVDLSHLEELRKKIAAPQRR